MVYGAPKVKEDDTRDWSVFRDIAKLQGKDDATLTAYYRYVSYVISLDQRDARVAVMPHACMPRAKTLYLHHNYSPRPALVLIKFLCNTIHVYAMLKTLCASFHMCSEFRAMCASEALKPHPSKV